MRCNTLPFGLRRMSSRCGRCCAASSPKTGLPARRLLSWNGGHAHRRRLEPGEFSVSANHAPAARSVRAAAQARAAVRVLGGGSVHSRRRRSPERPGVREGSLAVDGDAGVGVVRPDRLHRPGRRTCRRDRRRLVGESPTHPASATRSTHRPAPCRARGSFPAGRSAPTRCCSPRSAWSPVPRTRGAAGTDATLPQSLIVAVVADLVRRGVRALEAFGRTEAAAELADPRLVPTELRPVMEVLGDCSVDQCMLDADFLEAVGFVVVSQAPVLPAAAPRAGERPGLEGRCGGGAGAAAGEREAEAARRRGLEHLLSGTQLGLTRPAWSTDSSWASSSANVKVPVGRSFLPSR